MSDTSKIRRPRYAITAINMVGSDPGVAQWWLGNQFNQDLLGAEASGHGTDLKGATIVDEVLNLYGKELFERLTMGISALKRSITMGRVLGRPFLAGSQSYTGLASFYTNNNATIVALQNHNLGEAAAVAKALGMSPDRAPEIKGLKKEAGECFIWSSGWPQCVKAKFPFLDFGDYPSASEVEAKLAPELQWVRSRNVYATYPKPTSTPIDFIKLTSQSTQDESSAAPEIKPLLLEQLRFMRDLHDHPDDGLKAHYNRLDLHPEDGRRIVRELKAARLILIKTVKTYKPTGGRSLIVAYLTQPGREYLDAYENRKAN